MTFKNRVKQMLIEGKKTSGAWIQIASPFTAEIMSRAGFDWLLIDMEHGPGDILTLISQLQAMSGTDTCALVRTPWNDFVAIKRILDTGVHGLLIPYVNTKEEAEEAVRGSRLWKPQKLWQISIKSSPSRALMEFSLGLWIWLPIWDI